MDKNGTENALSTLRKSQQFLESRKDKEAVIFLNNIYLGNKSYSNGIEQTLFQKSLKIKFVNIENRC